nr:ChrR family anti-sigma-E factor [Puniceibacterium antarcticum]
MIKHHLTPDLMMAYSTGTLSEAFNLIVATHLSICDTCRAEVESYDALGGSVLETQDKVTLSDGCLARVFGLIDAGPAPEPAPIRDAVLPAPLTDYVGGTLDDVKWRPVGLGVKQAILPTSRDASARLLYIPAGAAMPDHGHRGMELTLVLKGAFEDEGGRFARGDIEIATEDTDHMPIADISEDCICLAVTNAPLRFKGLLPRLAQPFLKI